MELRTPPGNRRGTFAFSIRRQTELNRMDTVAHYWNEFWTFFREGLNQVNPIQAAIIALLGMMAVSSIVGLFIGAALSVVIHIIVSTLLPVLIDHKEFAAPKMDDAFWHYA